MATLTIGIACYVTIEIMEKYNEINKRLDTEIRYKVDPTDK